jgi:hypothetical protein
MRRWQYKVVIDKVLAGQMTPGSSEDSEREQILNAYGRDAWELVSIAVQSYRRESDPAVFYGYTIFRYYFKRVIEEPGEWHSCKMMTTQAPSKKTRKDLGIEGSVARWYARITENREDYHASAQKLTESVPAGGSVLEVAPGPGYLSIELIGFELWLRR